MSPDRKKGRDAAHRRAAQHAAREAQQRRQRKVRVTIIGGVAIAVIAALVFATFPSGDDKITTTASDDFSSSTTTVVDTTTPTSVAAGAFEYGTGECPPDSLPAEKPTTFSAAPMRCLDEGVDYAAEVVTSEGSFSIDLLETQAPGTVNNFVVLARYGFFDGLTFHRVVPGFMNQGGDPKGDGTGGPGYAIADELPSEGAYVSGAVAMANSGPKTNGSQFFTCVGCSSLPPAYSLFGQVTTGIEVVQAINDLGTGDGPPSKTVMITSIAIIEQ